MSEDSKKRILENLNKITSREEQIASSPGCNFLKTYHIPLVQLFEEKLSAVNGIFIYCKSKSDFHEFMHSFLNESGLSSIFCIESPVIELLQNTVPVSDDLTAKTEVAITGCEFLVAQTGSAILSTAQTHSRRSFVYPPVHIIVAGKSQLVDHLENGLNQIALKYKNNLPSQITTITGPSRTADIEKTLVLGAHGPNKLIIVYLEVEI